MKIKVNVQSLMLSMYLEFVASLGLQNAQLEPRLGFNSRLFHSLVEAPVPPEHSNSNNRTQIATMRELPDLVVFLAGVMVSLREKLRNVEGQQGDPCKTNPQIHHMISRKNFTRWTGILI